jgi:hypothetical protein
MDDSANTVVPIYNLPNLKQGQNGVEVAFAIYGIILDVKAHLPGPKELAVSYLVLLFLSSLLCLLSLCCNLTNLILLNIIFLL